MLLDWVEEFSDEDAVAVEEVTTGARSDEVVEGVGTELAVDNCADAPEASSAEGSGACEDWTGVALTSSFCWKTIDGSEAGTSVVVITGVDVVMASDGSEGGFSVVVVAAVGVAMASVLDDEHSEGILLGSFHRNLPSSMPLQTSFWPMILPLRTNATTVGPGRSTVLKTGATERLTA